MPFPVIITTLLIVHPPISVRPTFPSSPLAFSASAPGSLSTSASEGVLCVALSHLRTGLTRRNNEYKNCEDCFVARKIGIKRLKIEAQSLTQQVTVLPDQDAQRQRLLESRADQIASLRRDLSKARARSLALYDALAAKTHEFDQ